MIIVRFIGGLGNQMFQFALYHKLKNKYENVKGDIHGYSRYKLHEGYNLEKVFTIETDKASLSEVQSVTNFHNQDIVSKVTRKIFGNKSTHISENNFNEDKVDFTRDLYLDGYWQSPIYFGNEDQLKDALRFNKILSGLDSEIGEMINSNNSVSLHVRRGDYIGNKTYAHLGVVYYTNAIAQIQNHVNDPVFFIFSDDLDWVKENLRLQSQAKNIVYVESSNPSPGNDLRLMSMCKHNIIANSSFSWWGAWLNKNESKIVISPKQWYTDPTKNTNHIKEIPLTWMKI